MAVIRANRESIDDRFSVLGFTVRTSDPLYQLGLATDPALLRPENRDRRTPRNFFGSPLLVAPQPRNAVRGATRESVYLVPANVVARFVSQPRLYFGLATFSETDRVRPTSVQVPDAGKMYVSLAALTERGLRRTARADDGAGYGNGTGNGLAWGGDELSAAGGNGTRGNGTANSNGGAGPAVAPANGPRDDTAAPASAGYSDGYPDDLWSAPPAGPQAASQAPSSNGSGNGSNSNDRSNGSSAAAPAASAATGAATTPITSSQSLRGRVPQARAQEIIQPFYDPADAATALTCQADAASSAREEWFVGVPDTTIFPHSAICLLEMKDAGGNVTSRGTGFYISSNRILTCGHNLYDSDVASVDVVAGKNGQGSNTEPFGRFNVPRSQWRTPASYGGNNDATDLAVIDGVPAAPQGRWFDALEALDRSRPEGVVVCGYSSRSPKVPELTTAIDGYRQHLHGGYISALGDGDSTFEYPILTLKRASGAPVYYLSDRDGAMKAYVVGVHTGAATDETNKGCRLSAAKIAWIRGETTSLALSAERPRAKTGYGTRTGADNGDGTGIAVRRGAGPRVSSRTQGVADLLPVDLKIRVFIPAPVAMVTLPGLSTLAPGQSGHGGDGRGFQLDGGTSRAEVTARFLFGDGGAPTRLVNVVRSFGPSSNYNVDDTVEVAGKPAWFRNLRDGATPIERGSQTVTDAHISLERGGSSFHGILSMAENAAVVTFNLHASDPIVAGSPEIDATLAILLKIDGDRVKVRVNGGHDEFPAYEIYANGTLVYSFDPVAAGGSPWGLFGDGNWDVNPDSNYVDVGPASEYRLIGPVRISESQGVRSGARPTALSIPLDPGPGGQSISTDALQPGDIIVSTARHFVSYVIRGGTLSAISHAMIYIGDGHVVESVSDGVREASLEDAVGDSLLAVAYRLPHLDADTARMAVEYAIAQVGLPYNYTGVGHVGARVLFPIATRVYDAITQLTGAGTDDARSFYCSELVFDAYAAAGRPLSTTPGDGSSPQDVVRLAGKGLDYVGHLRARDEFLGVALGLGLGVNARALESGDTQYDVQLVPQPDKDACWAASMAMLAGFRGNASFAPEQLARDVGGSLASSYGFELLDAVRARYGFEAIEQPSNASLYHSPRQWQQWLAQYGPLWVVIVGAPHAVVLAGIKGDLDDPSAVTVKVMNPWDTRVAFDNDPITFNPPNEGYVDWLPFNQFASDFGEMAEPDYGNWRILHLPARAAVAVSQSLGGSGRRHTLKTPPPNVRSLGDSGIGSTVAPTRDPIEPSRIAGTRMATVRGQAGASRWQLEQVEGDSEPASASSAPTSAEPGETAIALGDWPAVDGEPSPLPLDIRFRGSARGAVGDLRIDAGLPAALAYGVDVLARVDRAPDANGVAALRVAIDYRFSGLAQGAPAARIELTLFGDGRYERVNRWVDASVAA